ncbi:flavin prenyltransferase UbiX [Teredinibacter purpureus]|uniref:flavin prenyltransferase UbiX n=1 Tax=Teredinibacter purpureus TaxID=2731756 RepID=UPI0005F85060|nr:flavin prenyltransferase UbiX [Teredinibacter purpureus]
MKHEKTITLALTGASGAQYGLRLLEALIDANCRVYFLISRAAEVVIATETNLLVPKNDSGAQQTYFQNLYGAHDGQLRVFSREDWMAPVASGSSSSAAMVICPASGGCLSAIANGASNNLIERAADVALKERRPLIMVPREAPYSEVHLSNMLNLTRMGVVIIPASPGFYGKPKSINDLVDFIVARILDQLEVPQTLLSRWGEE